MRALTQPAKCRILVGAAAHQGRALLRLRGYVVRMSDAGIAIVGLLPGSVLAARKPETKRATTKKNTRNKVSIWRSQTPNLRCAPQFTGIGRSLRPNLRHESYYDRV